MGLHLGKMLEDVGNETKNDGGGHGGAAGLIGIGDVEAIAEHLHAKPDHVLPQDLERAL